MTELTDRLVRDHLTDPEVRNVYHYDAHYHAEWTMFSRALDRAHEALRAAGNEEADRIAEILSMGLPDMTAAQARIAEAKREAMRLSGWGVQS